MISLLIIDANSHLRIGIQAAVEAEGGVEVIGDAAPDEQVVKMVERLHPDVVLMSLKWPDGYAVAACKEIRERAPSTKVVVLSYKDWEGEMLISVLVGASGYVSNNAQGPELVQAIRTAVNGGGYFDFEVVQRLICRLQKAAGDSPTVTIPNVLSGREIVVLRMVGEGYRNKEISRQLNIATSTVRNNITRIRYKLGLDSRAKLMAYAFRHGLMDDVADGASIPDAAN